MNRARNMLLSILVFSSTAIRLDAWTWLHKFQPASDKRGLVRRYGLEWTKESVPEFDQLIFSFNALRPQEGHFVFLVQVRDSKTKKWFPWHQMAHWGTHKGKPIQRSFESAPTFGSAFHYVRLQLPKNKLADGFRVKVRLQGAAHIEDLKQVAVNTVNNTQFSSEIGAREIAGLSSVYIPRVPKYSQMVLDHPEASSLCSPTSTSMVLSYLLKKSINPVHVANGVFDQGLGVYGSWPFNVAHAFEVSGGKVAWHVERLDSFKVLHQQLKKSIPVVVSIRGTLKGGAKPYPNGHLVVVVGYDRNSRRVICHDPAFKSRNKTSIAYPLNDFLRAWERSNRLAYIARPLT